MERAETIQKLECDWLMYENRCNKSFHSKMKEAKSKNKIWKIKDDKNIERKGQIEVVVAFKKHFKNHIGSQKSPIDNALFS